MFSKINKSNVYLCSNHKSECKRFTIHITNKEFLIELKQKLLDLIGLDLSTLIPKQTKCKNVLKDMEWYQMPVYEVESKINETLIFLILYTDKEQHILDSIVRIMNNPKITNRSCWYPERLSELNSLKNKKVIETNKIIPKYPIYIISKGRYESGTTAKYLDICQIDYRLVIEPSEYDLYLANGYNSDKILICPENFSQQGNGGIPVRNFVWEHAKNTGSACHWILDDNIKNYFRVNRGQRTIIYSGAIFKIIEDYADRYTNVKMCGHNYSFFVVSSENPYPIIKNTRIYSSILLSNDIFPEFKWRGRYNEDTDLSLRILKAGYPTLLFNNICANKMETMKSKGGNTDTIYSVDNAHLKKTQELVDNHSDCCEIVNKYGRVHHSVNYNSFKHLMPIWKDGIKETLTTDNNEYEMKYIDL